MAEPAEIEPDGLPQQAPAALPLPLSRRDRGAQFVRTRLTGTAHPSAPAGCDNEVTVSARSSANAAALATLALTVGASRSGAPADVQLIVPSGKAGVLGKQSCGLSEFVRMWLSRQPTRARARLGTRVSGGDRVATTAPDLNDGNGRRVLSERVREGSPTVIGC